MPYGFIPKLVSSRDSISVSPVNVGKAAYDILSKENREQTVEETIAEMTQKYYDEMMKAAERGNREYRSPFYIVVSRKKETLGGNVTNVLFHKYTTRQTKPSGKFLRSEFPNHDHDVYEVDGGSGNITLLFTLPTAQDSKTILKNKHQYDSQLVKWIEDFEKGLLD